MALAAEGFSGKDLSPLQLVQHIQFVRESGRQDHGGEILDQQLRLWFIFSWRLCGLIGRYGCRGRDELKIG